MIARKRFKYIVLSAILFLLGLYCSVLLGSAIAEPNPVVEDVLSRTRVKFIDKAGKTVIGPISCFAFSGFSGGVARIYMIDENGGLKETGRRKLLEGFIDKNGQWTYGPAYFDGHPNTRYGTRRFCEGLAVKQYYPSRSEDSTFIDIVRFGFIDRKGDFVISPKGIKTGELERTIIGYAADFSEGISLIRHDTYVRESMQYPAFQSKKRYSFIDRAGSPLLALSPDMEAIEPADQSDIYLEVLPELYEQESADRAVHGSSFSNGHSLIRYKGKFGFIDRRGDWLSSTVDNALPFSEGLAYVRKGERAGFIDGAGKMVLELPRTPITYPASFHEGLCRQRVSRKNGVGNGAVIKFIDKMGKTVFSIDELRGESYLSYVGDFSCGLCLVRTLDKGCGYIDKTGKWKIPPQYLRAEPFNEGVARVMTDETHLSYIDTNGKVIWSGGGGLYGSKCGDGLIGIWTH